MPPIRHKMTSGNDACAGHTKPTQRASYQRYPKPPYSYLGMMVMAIRTSPRQMLTLSEIHQTLQNMFQFFSSGYNGWKDSVRHNLSHNKCFKKVLKDPLRNNSKGNYWMVDIDAVPADAFKRQDTVVAREGDWDAELHRQLGLPPIILPSGGALSRLPASCPIVAIPSLRDEPNAVPKPQLSFSIDNILRKDSKGTKPHHAPSQTVPTFTDGSDDGRSPPVSDRSSSGVESADSSFEGPSFNKCYPGNLFTAMYHGQQTRRILSNQSYYVFNLYNSMNHLAGRYHPYYASIPYNGHTSTTPVLHTSSAYIPLCPSLTGTAMGQIRDIDQMKLPTLPKYQSTPKSEFSKSKLSNNRDCDEMSSFTESVLDYSTKDTE